MLPANATSLFCWYPLGTWHKLCVVMCAVVFCVILNYPVLLCQALCSAIMRYSMLCGLCHIRNGYLLFLCYVLIYELA